MTSQKETRTRRAVWLRGIPPAIVVAAALCGCGAASSSSSASSGAPGRAAFFQCLKQHGVTLPSGSPGAASPGQAPFGGNPSAVRKAMQACGSLAPRGTNGGFGGGFGGPPGGAPNFTGFIACLKRHHVTVTGTGPVALPSLNQNDPATRKAISACRSTLQQGSSG